MTYEEYCEIMDYSNFMIDSENPYDMKIMQALEKQIHKSPKIETRKIYHEFGDSVEIEYKTFYRCPKCNGYIRRSKCCDNNDCRQAIDWSDEE